MNNVKQSIVLALSFVLIVGGLALDAKLNVDTVHASYNATADSIFTVPGTIGQYLRGDDTWQTLNPAAMGVPSGTTAQYFRGDLSLAAFPAIPATQLQSDWNETNTGLLDYIKNKPTISTPAFNAAPGRSLSTTGSNNTFTISSTNNARVYYTVNFSIALIAAASNGFVALDYSTNAGSTWVNAADVSQVYSVAVSLTNNVDNVLSGEIPAGALVRIYRSSNTNTTISLGRQEEVTY